MITLVIAEGADKARKVFNDVNAWYALSKTKDFVRAEARKVKAWLVENKHSTDKRGDERSEPWWPDDLDATADDDRLDYRLSAFRKRLYGHGTRRLLNRMVAARLLATDALDVIDDLTDFACMAFYEELAGYELAKNGTTVSLVDLKERFGLSNRTNPTKMRDGIVQRMAKCGLWEVKVDAENRFKVKLGPVAKIFHEEVFSPVRKEFKPKLGGESK